MSFTFRKTWRALSFECLIFWIRRWFKSLATTKSLTRKLVFGAMARQNVIFVIVSLVTNYPGSSNRPISYSSPLSVYKPGDLLHWTRFSHRRRNTLTIACLVGYGVQVLNSSPLIFGRTYSIHLHIDSMLRIIVYGGMTLMHGIIGLDAISSAVPLHCLGRVVDERGWETCE